MIMGMFRVMLMVLMVFMVFVMLIMCRFGFTRPVFQEKDNVDELEYAKSVKDNKSDEPPYLSEFGRMPESIAL